MAKKNFKKYLPTPETLKKHQYLKFLGNALLNDYLWYLNRKSVAKAYFIGIFWAFIPIPFQMVPAALCALFFKCNLPLSIALVWITNPITMPPIWYATYRFGCFLLQIPATISLTTLSELIQTLMDDFNMDHINNLLAGQWKPLYLGSLVAGLILGITAFMTVKILWKIRVSNKWRKRNKKTSIIK